LCADCAPSLDGTCVGCARLRPGHLSRTGSFYCDSRRRRAERTCAIGQRVRSVQANWPAGPAYATCYARVRDQPSPCAGCAKVRALIGVDSAGQGDMRRSGVSIDYRRSARAGAGRLARPEHHPRRPVDQVRQKRLEN
jgi:hypothetical protein